MLVFHIVMWQFTRGYLIILLLSYAMGQIVIFTKQQLFYEPMQAIESHGHDLHSYNLG